MRWLLLLRRERVVRPILQCSSRVSKREPVIASPAEHAADRTKRKHGAKSVQRMQFTRFEANRLAARASAPEPQHTRQPIWPDDLGAIAGSETILYVGLFHEAHGASCRSLAWGALVCSKARNAEGEKGRTSGLKHTLKSTDVRGTARYVSILEVEQKVGFQECGMGATAEQFSRSSMRCRRIRLRSAKAFSSRPGDDVLSKLLRMSRSAVMRCSVSEVTKGRFLNRPMLGPV